MTIRKSRIENLPINDFNHIITVGDVNMEILDDEIHLWLQSARFVKAKPGVYVLYDKNEDVIYIGESENLQNQFAKYVDTNFENDTCKQKTHTYQREFVENPKERRKQLLEDFKNKNGKLPLCNDVS